MDYATLSYKKILKLQIEAQKNLGADCSYTGLARFTKTQKTYVSRVFNSDTAHFSRDQLYGACRYAGLNDDETDFCLLLLDHATAHNRDRIAALKARIKEIQRRQLASDKVLDQERIPALDPVLAARYYLDPDALLVHMLLTIPAWQVRPLKATAAALGIPEPRLAAVLGHLAALGLVAVDPRSGARRATVDRTHLAPGSELAEAHQTLLKLRAVERARQVAPAEKLSFLAAFTATEEVAIHIKARILQVIKEIDRGVAAAAPERLYHLAFDLFPWTEN